MLGISHPFKTEERTTWIYCTVGFVIKRDIISAIYDPLFLQAGVIQACSQTKYAHMLHSWDLDYMVI